MPSLTVQYLEPRPELGRLTAGEVRAGQAAGISMLLFGIKSNDVAGVARLERSQLQADLAAVQAAGVDGLARSWDLRHMPLDRLALVRNA